MSIGSARPMNSVMLSALSRAMCTTQRLCSMNVVGQFGTSSVKGNLIQVIRLQRTAFQRLDPGFGHLLAQLGRAIHSISGHSLVFALLVAAIIWNLGTWYFGLPASSSHTLIGSIIGVGIANQLLSPKTGTSGVDWGQAANIGKSLLLSPLVGFVCAFLLLFLMKAVIKNRALYEAPVGSEPPPFWIRGR
jgi:hypothetical protein